MEAIASRSSQGGVERVDFGKEDTGCNPMRDRLVRVAHLRFS